MSPLLASRDGGLRESRPRAIPRPSGPDFWQFVDRGGRPGPVREQSEAFVVPWQLPEVSEGEG